MKPFQRLRPVTAAIVLIPCLLAGCVGWGPAPGAKPKMPAAQPTMTFIVLPTLTPSPLPQPEAVSAVGTPEEVLPAQQPDQPQVVGEPEEPAGCLSLEKQSQLASVEAMLDYASGLVSLRKQLTRRLLPSSWNAYTRTNLPPESGALSLAVGDVDPDYLVQRTLNALQVAGFVTWLRRSPARGLHILAIPLRGPARTDSPWEPYLRAYWADSRSIPEGDPTIISASKTPPCRWMVSQGYAEKLMVSSWDAGMPAAPDYARAAAAYLANTTDEAAQAARRINWLGDEGVEGPNTMCGPLAWAIMNDAGALPPGYGGWSIGAKAFWLAKPLENGRPWSLFPPELYSVKHYKEPLGAFDFRARQPLYPGDFMYTYSIGDGFDHMLVVTETDETGGVYTVTNIIHMAPEKKTTIERVLLLNLNDPSQGIARNRWAKDRTNGRTGHHGFDVFRWAWVQKDIDRKPAKYTVQPGDRLSAIAVLWRTPANQIARYNGITVDSALTVSQSLWIPPNMESGGAP